MTQDEALAILKTGLNVFLTGEPGSGKTHTINQYVAWLRVRGIEPAVTASTGIAATHINGMTIHACYCRLLCSAAAQCSTESLCTRESSANLFLQQAATQRCA